MKWIKALELEQWASTLQAREKMPALVADLIWATALNVLKIRFLHSDKAEVRGFDGYLDVKSDSPFVPNGKSIWEFGTSGTGKVKAERDYKKRTEEVDEVERQECVLVIVTPRTWDTPKEKLEDWLANKNDLKEWKSVIYLDGPQLEDWLEKCPAVASRWASRELKIAPQNGARSTEEFWQYFSCRFRPQLVEEVLLAGREEQAEELLRNLTQQGGRLAFSADTTDEVIAFAVAAIRMAPEMVRKPLEARALILETEDAARFLVNKPNLIYLPRYGARHYVGVLMSCGPTVVSAGADDRKNGHVELLRPTNIELAKALVKMGFSEENGYETARKCGRSLAVLARQNPSGTAERPNWLEEDPSALIPVVLAGAWSSEVEADKLIISSLSQKNYDEAEDDLRKYLIMQDSPIECISDLWSAKASVDAFLHLGHLIGRRHLSLFKDAITTVFEEAAHSHAPPSADDPFIRYDKRGSDSSHSDYLRNGLMTTLLHMAVLHDAAGFKIPGKCPQTFVDELVRSLPGLSSDHRLIASLGRDLALLAEASPNAFLEALELQLEGPSPSILPIFDEHPGMLSPVTFHSGLLRALETLAWDSILFDRVVLCLAKLAKIDPGGKLSNRPVNSLRAIFISWAPSTSVKTKRRLAVLEATLKSVPSIAWPLLCQLLPQSGDSISTIQRPKFREYELNDGEILTYGLIWESEAKIVSLAIDEAGEDPERWVTLIEVLASLQDAPFRKVIASLDEALNSLAKEASQTIWKTLNGEVKRHQAYSNFNWAMPKERIEELSKIAEKYAPMSVVELNSWLFDEYFPPMEVPGQEDNDSDDAVLKARLSALNCIWIATGNQGILDLIARVELPRVVIFSITGLNLSYDQRLDLFIKVIHSSVPELELLAGVIMADGMNRHEKGWINAARDALQDSPLDFNSIALILESLSEDLDSWKYVSSFGEEVEYAYWSGKSPRPIVADMKSLRFAIDRYRFFGRPNAALWSISNRLNEISANEVFSLLEEGVTEHNSSTRAGTESRLIDVERVIKDLAARSDMSCSKLARLEFIYLPVLRDAPQVLHKLLLKSPDFFLEMVCNVFRAKDEEPGDLSDQDREFATNAYRLLKSLKSVPGQHESGVDETVLLEWCVAVRDLAIENNRLAITEQLIGQVLAHAPMNSEGTAWPHEAVCNVIESLASSEVELGITIERFNMRGAFTKHIGEGGQQERGLANQAREWAEASREYVRTSAMLMRIARSWDEEAERADTRAQQDALRF